MGNTPSKSNPTQTTEKHISSSTFASTSTTTSQPAFTPLHTRPNSTSSTPNTKEDGAKEGDPHITHPTPHPRSTRKHALSELIEPQDLAIDAQVCTPEGEVLAPEQFFVRRDRPVCLRERRERIVRRVEVAVAEAKAEAERKGGVVEEVERPRCWGWCF